MSFTYASTADLNLIRSTCFQPARTWTPPTADEFRIMLNVLGYSQTTFAAIIDVTDRTVRRWAKGEKPIAYSAWCVMCTQAGLPSIWSLPIPDDAVKYN